jgi:hypothetical protein
MGDVKPQRMDIIPDPAELKQPGRGKTLFGSLPENQLTLKVLLLFAASL